MPQLIPGSPKEAKESYRLRSRTVALGGQRGIGDHGISRMPFEFYDFVIFVALQPKSKH